MSAEATGNHYLNVLQRDCDFLWARKDQIMAQVSGLQYLQNSLRYFYEQNLINLGPIEPRIGLKLLNSAFESLEIYQKNTDQSRMGRLRQVIGSTLLPMSGIAPAAAAAEGRLWGEVPDNCDSAEEYFSNAVDRIRGNGYAMHPQWLRVYHDESGQLLALRKSWDVTSSLTLQPVSLGEVVLPPGTIVKISSRSKYMPQTGRAKINHQAGQIDVSTCLVEGALPLFPARISPWAYESPLDRSLFAVNTQVFREDVKPDINPARKSLAENYSLDDFREAAQTIMHLCTGAAVPVPA